MDYHDVPSFAVSVGSTLEANLPFHDRRPLDCDLVLRKSRQETSYVTDFERSSMLVARLLVDEPCVLFKRNVRVELKMTICVG